MSRPPSDDRAWHRLIERYTPDGRLGRLLFGLIVGSFSVTAGVFGLAVVATPPSVVGFLLGLVLATAGTAGTLLTLVALWPVYLSLIGNIDTPAAYGRTPTTDTGSELTGQHPDDNVEILKRVYAEGKISHEEYERRLDALVDAPDGTDDETDTGRDTERLRE